MEKCQLLFLNIAVTVHEGSKVAADSSLLVKQDRNVFGKICIRKGMILLGMGGHFKLGISLLGAFQKAEFCHEAEKFHPCQCSKETVAFSSMMNRALSNRLVCITVLTVTWWAVTDDLISVSAQIFYKVPSADCHYFQQLRIKLLIVVIWLQLCAHFDFIAFCQ